MYTSKDIQNMIEKVANDRNFMRFVSNSGISNADFAAIAYVLKTEWHETFDRYDSAVCDHFIRLYEKFNK